MPWILNFPTKDHWRSVSKIEDIIKGLEHLQDHYKEWGITSLAIPPLGCGEGQLDWSIVGPTLYRYICSLDIPVELYAPFGTPEEELNPEFLKGTLNSCVVSAVNDFKKIKPAWVALVEILFRIEQQPYHWEIGRTMFQKIAYAATETGIPTGLHFEKGSYGPFSSELKGLIAKLVNNGLIKESRLGRMFAVRVGPTFSDARTNCASQIEVWDCQIEKVKDLFMRIDTKKSEIVATVLYATRDLKAKTSGSIEEKEILEAVMQWKQKRRPPLDEREVALTIRNLSGLNWLDVKPSCELAVEEDMLV